MGQPWKLGSRTQGGHICYACDKRIVLSLHCGVWQPRYTSTCKELPRREGFAVDPTELLQREAGSGLLLPRGILLGEVTVGQAPDAGAQSHPAVPSSVLVVHVCFCPLPPVSRSAPTAWLTPVDLGSPLQREL
ncbi:Hypothetical predicted protein [Marmota monax]|uniref:Uncharacterized protein n=1 Tax=Marmota monax TaxID=9995 RepID=A0A5E4AA25_MARMO|nr:Hypothetical predicted protein [Marmota monax]